MYSGVSTLAELAVLQRTQLGCFGGHVPCKQGPWLQDPDLNYVTCLIPTLRHFFLICQMHQNVHKSPPIWKRDTIEGGNEGKT